MKIVLRDREAEPKDNAERVIEKFIWFPKVMCNPRGNDELRWLCFARVHQFYSTCGSMFSGDSGWTDLTWAE